MSRSVVTEMRVFAHDSSIVEVCILAGHSGGFVLCVGVYTGGLIYWILQYGMALSSYLCRIQMPGFLVSEPL